MKIKTLKTKQLVALALALFMVMPMLLVTVRATGTYPASGTPPYIDVVPTGGTASQTTTNIPAQLVGTTFSVDVRIDNYADVNLGGSNNGVNSASYMVTWNPSVLSFVSYTDGSWLPSQTSGFDVTSNTGSGQLTIGQIAFGSSKQQVANSATGSVSATIEFSVASTGTTLISIQPSQAGVAYLQAPTSTSASASSGNVPGTLTYNALYNPVTAISLYEHGTSTNTVQLPPGTSLPATFQMDIYINNPLPVKIWAWNIGVTWNPAALQLTNIAEGTYLNQTGNTMFVPGYVNNNAGNIPQGISDVYLENATTTAAAGVLATLTFEVINYANSNINLAQGIPTLMNNYEHAITPVLLNNATYVTISPPPPTSPVAVITNTATNTQYTNGYTIPTSLEVNTNMSLSAVNSIPGNDVVPNPTSPTFAIQSYAWSYSVSPSTGPALTITPGLTSEAVTITTPSATQVTQTLTYTVTLVVTSASNPGDSHYDPTSAATTLIFTVVPAYLLPTTNGAQIDVYIINPTTATTTDPIISPTGVGANAACGSFGPQQQMNLAAYVTYNGAPVADKEVQFQVTSNTGTIIATWTNMTDETGTATASYRLPWVDGAYSTGPASEFGIWNVYASVVVQQTSVNDTMPFYFGDIAAFASAPTVTTSIEPRSSTTTTYSDTVNVALLNYNSRAIKCYVTYTVLDSGNVPVATGESTCTFASGATFSGSATYSAPATAGTFKVTPSQGSTSATFAIPSWAFVGGATIQVNVYDADPLSAAGTNTNANSGSTTAAPGNVAVAYCPQQIATFTIAIPAS